MRYILFALMALALVGCPRAPDTTAATDTTPDHAAAASAAQIATDNAARVILERRVVDATRARDTAAAAGDTIAL